MKSIVFTDRVLDQINLSVGSVVPESGGALLGIPGTNIITNYIHDNNARTSHSSFTPSKKLNHDVNEIEARLGLSFFGILHSHPDGLENPSHGDLISYSSSLSVNPHLGFIVVPIVNIGQSHFDSKNRIVISDECYMSSFVARRTISGKNSIFSRNIVDITEPYVYLFKINENINSLIQGLKSNGYYTDSVDSSFLEINGSLFFSELIKLENGFSVAVIIPPLYPMACPSIFVSKIDKDVVSETKEVKIDWSFIYNSSYVFRDFCLNGIIDSIS